MFAAVEFEKLGLADVLNAAALRADHVVVRLAVHFNAQRTVMRADFAQDAAGEEQMDVLVDGGQRNRRDQFPHLDKDFFRAGMAVHGLHDLVDDLALVRDSQSLTGAEIAKCLR